MFKTALAAASLLALASLPVRAETIDISTIKCSDLAKMNQDEASYLLIWLHGYYGGQANDTTIDLDSFAENGKAIGEECAKSPELGLMTVINQLDGGDDSQ
ncbi:MAG: HdeA/HdeB family chaperone [Hyphomicrobiales bacterium]